MDDVPGHHQRGDHRQNGDLLAALDTVATVQTSAVGIALGRRLVALAILLQTHRLAASASRLVRQVLLWLVA